MRDLTQGSVTRHLLQLSGFLSVSLILQTLYTLADMYWVGGLGPPAIAAVSLSGNLFFFVMAVGQVVNVGTTTLVSQATGAKNHTRAGFVFNQSTFYGMVLGVLVLTAVYLVRPYYFGWMGGDEQVDALGRGYLLWLAPALLAQLSAMGLSGSLRGIGDLKTPMIINAAAVLMNCILDPVLIYGWGPAPRLGVQGAAIATLAAVAAAWLLLACFFTRPRSFLRFNPRSWFPEWKTYSEITRIGLPAGAQFAILSSFMVLIFWAISIFGTAAQAGYGLGQRLLTSLFLPVIAVSVANAPVVGQNFGAGQAQRVKSAFYSASAIGMGMMLVLTVACRLAPEWLIGLFTADSRVISYGAGYLRIVSWNFVASAAVLTTSSTFQGLGNTLPPLLSSVCRFGIFAIPLLWMARRPGFEINQVWWLWAMTVFVQAGLNLFLLRRGFRRYFKPLLQAPAPLNGQAEPLG